MTYRITFTTGGWQDVVADHSVFDQQTLALIRDGKPIFVGVMRNICHWRVLDEPQHLPLAAQCGCASVSA